MGCIFVVIGGRKTIQAIRRGCETGIQKATRRLKRMKGNLFRLDLVIQGTCHLFQVLAEQKKIALEIGSIQEVIVIGDKLRLQQLFTNLIDNAIKYTSEGSIHVTVEKNEGAARVKIKYTGIGIHKEEQEKIFKRFYRVDNSRSKETGGVSLGLSIAEWIVQAHRGKIGVQSRLEKGSTFIVRLPLFNPEDRNSQP